MHRTGFILVWQHDDILVYSGGALDTSPLFLALAAGFTASASGVPRVFSLYMEGWMSPN